MGARSHTPSPPTPGRVGWWVVREQTTASCIASRLSGGSARPMNSGPHDPTFPHPRGKAGAPCSEPHHLATAPSCFRCCSGSVFHFCLLHETRGGGDPALHTMALPVAGSRNIPVSKVQLSFGLRWNFMKSVQTLPFKLCLHPRPVATGWESGKHTLPAGRA